MTHSSEDSVIELYYYENSICAERPLMVFEEKDIRDWRRHHIHLFKGEQFKPEYLKLNPKGVVPTLIHDGRVIREFGNHQRLHRRPVRYQPAETRSSGHRGYARVG